MEELPLAGDAPNRSRSLYETLGDQTFRDLTDAFYRRVETDPLLRPMFPGDLAEARERQYWFLVQLFGGPPLFNQHRGAPRMRIRHFPFPIGRAERDAWLAHMLAAIEAVAVPEPEASVLRSYFENASLAMMNRP
jgi:hemoglobin